MAFVMILLLLMISVGAAVLAATIWRPRGMLRLAAISAVVAAIGLACALLRTEDQEALDFVISGWDWIELLSIYALILDAAIAAVALLTLWWRRRGGTRPTTV